MKYYNRINKFMHERYCRIDEFYKFLFILYVIILIINLFLNLKILSLINLLIFIYTTYRLFSKNTSKRYAENLKYLKIKQKIKNIFTKNKNYNNIYKKCHYCHTKLKLPIPERKGIKQVICPKCHQKNHFIITKQIKVEIIKNKK